MKNTLEEYLKSKGVNDLTDQETVRKLTQQYLISDANCQHERDNTKHN